MFEVFFDRNVFLFHLISNLFHTVGGGRKEGGRRGGREGGREGGRREGGWEREREREREGGRGRVYAQRTVGKVCKFMYLTLPALSTDPSTVLDPHLCSSSVTSFWEWEGDEREGERREGVKCKGGRWEGGRWEGGREGGEGGKHKGRK